MNFKNLNCKWLWRDLSDAPNQYVTFKQKIILQDTNCHLYICCDTNYVAKLNGTVVGFGQYLAYPENKYYDILDMSHCANEGENTLTIDVYYQGESFSCYAKGTPGLIYAVETKQGFLPNSNVICRKTKGYQEGKIPYITKQLGLTFEYKASEISDFWQDATELVYSNFLPVSLRRRPVKKLITNERTEFSPHTAGKFRINTDSLNASDRISTALCAPFNTDMRDVFFENELTVTDTNTYIIFDLGGETTGYFTMDIEAEEGTRIDIGYGEHITDGRVRCKITDRNFAFTYYTKNGENHFTDYFRRIGAKYLQLNFSNVLSPVKIKYVGLIKAYYPVFETEMPNLSDALDKKIYQSAVKTLKCCMHEHYEDSPWREQSLYALDSRNQTLFGYSAFRDNNEFIKASIDLLGSSLREDGYLDLTAPSSGKKTIPCFTLVWIIWLAEYVLQTSDKYYFMQHEPKVKKIITQMQRTMVDGIIPTPTGERIWNFYDWAEELDDVSEKYDALLNMYFCLALKKLMQIDKCFRDDEFCFKIRKIYKKIKTSVNKKFYDSECKCYNTFASKDKKKHKLTQALAIVSGVAKRKTALYKVIISDTDMVDTTLCTKQFEYEALAHKITKYDTYILDDIRNIWGKMIFEGADTFYETKNGDRAFSYAGSLCHGWSAAPVYWYQVLFGKHYLKLK